MSATYDMSDLYCLFNPILHGPSNVTNRVSITVIILNLTIVMDSIEIWKLKCTNCKRQI